MTPQLADYRNAKTAQDRISRALSGLLSSQPYIGIPAMHLLPAIPDPKVSTLAADGISLYYNPDWVAQAQSREIIQAVAHCVMACVLKHHTRRGDRTYLRWQKASRLVTQHILLQQGLADPANGLGLDMSITMAYQSLPPDRPGQDSQQAQSPPEAGNPDPNANPGPGQPDPNQQDAGNSPPTPSPAANQDHSQGDSPSPANTPPDQQPQAPPGQTSGSGQQSQDQSQQGTPPPGSSGSPSPSRSNDPPPQANQDQRQPGSGQQDHRQQPDPYDPSLDHRGEVMDYPADQPTDAPGQSEDDPPPPPSSRNRAEEHRWDDISQQALQMASAQGNTPGDMKERIARSHAPSVDWETQLQEFMTACSPEERTLSIPNRRHIARGIYLPSPRRDHIPEICFAIDTSASLNKAALARCWTEIREVAETIKPGTIRVIQCDTAIQHEELHDGDDLPDEIVAYGRGGTDFRPVFELLDSEPPEFMIYLTDLDCTRFPHPHPPYPVLWVCTKPRNPRIPPFGERIDLPTAPATGR